MIAEQNTAAVQRHFAALLEQEQALALRLGTLEAATRLRVQMERNAGVRLALLAELGTANLAGVPIAEAVDAATAELVGITQGLETRVPPLPIPLPPDPRRRPSPSQ